MILEHPVISEVKYQSSLDHAKKDSGSRKVTWAGPGGRLRRGAGNGLEGASSARCAEARAWRGSRRRGPLAELPAPFCRSQGRSSEHTPRDGTWPGSAAAGLQDRCSPPRRERRGTSGPSRRGCLLYPGAEARSEAARPLLAARRRGRGEEAADAGRSLSSPPPFARAPGLR